MKPYFSVIIPTYNRAYILPAAVTSVQNQTNSNWELIVIDDGSQDNTREIVKSLADQDNRIHYLHQNNAGPSSARNLGWQKAAGDIVVYLDSDDTLLPTFLEKVAGVFSDKPETVFGIPNHYRHIILVNAENKIVKENPEFIAHKPSTVLQDIYFWNAKATGSGIFHKKDLDPKICWDESIKYGEDWDFILQCGRLYADFFAYIPEPLVSYVQKYGIEGQCANATYADWAQMYVDIYERHKDDPLLAGQTWYPERVERYTKLQAQVDAGEIPPAMYKYFQ